MGWTYFISFTVALSIFWGYTRFVEDVLSAIRRKYYARKHFKLNERYRREL